MPVGCDDENQRMCRNGCDDCAMARSQLNFASRKASTGHFSSLTDVTGSHQSIISLTNWMYCGSVMAIPLRATSDRVTRSIDRPWSRATFFDTSGRRNIRIPCDVSRRSCRRIDELGRDRASTSSLSSRIFHSSINEAWLIGSSMSHTKTMLATDC